VVPSDPDINRSFHFIWRPSTDSKDALKKWTTRSPVAARDADAVTSFGGLRVGLKGWTTACEQSIVQRRFPNLESCGAPVWRCYGHLPNRPASGWKEGRYLCAAVYFTEQVQVETFVVHRQPLLT
jgi:hypothetical protein